MQTIRLTITIGFLIMLAIFISYGIYFRAIGVDGMLNLEFARPENGKTILASWQQEGLLSVARILTWIDFLFIGSYVGVIITLSNQQVRREPSIPLNALLRANFFIAALIGLFDFAENICLLRNMCNIDSNTYWSTWWIAMLKFILAAWVVLVWLVSFVKSKIT
jgi:phosphoglycerol transferase MdoB-like AlkP superfamily enzyme